MSLALAAGAGASLSDVVSWHPHLDVLGLIVALVIVYEVGLRRLASDYAPQGEPTVRIRQRVMFYGGVLTLGIVSSWPIHDIGENSLFTFHMIEHLGMALVAPPLLLAGVPGWLMTAVFRPLIPVLRVLTKPLIALVLFNGTLAFIHVPSVVRLMLTNSPFHFVAHGALFLTAILMWWPVIGPIPEIRALAPFEKMGYLFLQSLVPTIPASFLTLGTTPLYPIYETFPRLWGWTVMNDQVVAGLVMKLGGGLILWGFIAAVFFRWYEDERRHDMPPQVVRSS